jgi:hypothetical protein
MEKVPASAKLAAKATRDRSLEVVVVFASGLKGDKCLFTGSCHIAVSVMHSSPHSTK